MASSSSSRSFEKEASDVRSTTAKSIESQSEPCKEWATTWRNGCAHKQPPVVLQHSTHSRTVVGFLVRSSEEYLIMLDPAKYLSAADFDKQSWEVLISDFNTSKAQISYISALTSFFFSSYPFLPPSSQRLVFVSTRSLQRHAQYQLIHVLPGPFPEDRHIMRNPNANCVKR